MQCPELQNGISDTHLYFLLIFRLSRAIKVLYHLMRFTKNNAVFAQLSLSADLELCLHPPLLMCLEKENRAGKSCSAEGPQELCSML